MFDKGLCSDRCFMNYTKLKALIFIRASKKCYFNYKINSLGAEWNYQIISFVWQATVVCSVHSHSTIFSKNFKEFS